MVFIAKKRVIEGWIDSDRALLKASVWNSRPANASKKHFSYLLSAYAIYHVSPYRWLLSEAEEEIKDRGACKVIAH